MALVIPTFSPSQLKSWMFSTWEYISLCVTQSKKIGACVNKTLHTINYSLFIQNSKESGCSDTLNI